MYRLALVIVVACLGTQVLAESLPKAEIGVGLAAQHLRDYRGSTQSQTQVLPFPFLVYRGERIQADKDGIRGRFIRGKNWELNVSAEAALNGGSEENEKRQGMPALNSAVEFGPSVNINLTGSGMNNGWGFRLPMRAVFAVDTSSIEHIGFNINPKFTYRKPEFWLGWNGKVDLGLLWGSQDYHDYYYTVTDRYTTEFRPQYYSESGYSGTYLKFSLKKRARQFWYGWNLRYDYLQGTVFEDSPLFETDSYFSTTFAVGWFFWRSDD